MCAETSAARLIFSVPAVWRQRPVPPRPRASRDNIMLCVFQVYIPSQAFLQVLHKLWLTLNRILSSEPTSPVDSFIWFYYVHVIEHSKLFYAPIPVRSKSSLKRCSYNLIYHLFSEQNSLYLSVFCIKHVGLILISWFGVSAAGLTPLLWRGGGLRCCLTSWFYVFPSYCVLSRREPLKEALRDAWR